MSNYPHYDGLLAGGFPRVAPNYGTAQNAAPFYTEDDYRDAVARGLITNGHHTAIHAYYGSEAHRALAMETQAYRDHLAARPPCTNICCQPLQPVENNHMPLAAYEVAEMEQPINWVIEIISVLLAAVAAGFVVFVLGW